MKKCRMIGYCLVAILSTNNLVAQDKLATDATVEIPPNYPSTVDKKINGLDRQLSRQSRRYLNDLAKEEERILKKLSAVDSSRVGALLNNSKEAYQQFSQKIENANGKVAQVLSGQYLANLDSLQGALGFLKDAGNIVSKSKDIQQKLGNSLQQVRQLQNKLNEAENIKAFVQQRQQQLKEMLSNYANLPKDISKYMGKYSQRVYYYGREIQEIKESINDPDKMVKKVLSVLNQVPKFKEFMNKYSMLSGLFASANASTAVDPSLPTRDQVMQLVQQRIGAGGQGAQQAFSQQLQQAQSEMAKLKEKFSEMGISPGGDMNMPDFKPNNLRTKKFLQRIELGSNIQSSRANNYFPVSSDLAFSAGYRLDEKKTIGLAVSGKVGWGKSFRQINITSQGVGMRLYVEWRAKGNIWLTGGAEVNYLRPIESLAVFKNYSSWNKSALAGISRKYKVGKKLKGNMQVLYDFMHRKHTPATDAIVWRVGYNF